MSKVSQGKKVAPAPFKNASSAASAESKPTAETVNPLFANYKPVTKKLRDVTRWVRYPSNVRIQRQKAILYERLKVPPSINQFTLTLNKQTAFELFRFCKNYVPETKKEKYARLAQIAAMKVEGKEVDSRHGAKLSVKQGVNHVVKLIEAKKAKLVVIAHDVDPIEIVLYMPALCRKMGIPYVIVKGKARIGCLANSKTATCIAITDVADKDVNSFAKLLEAIKLNYSDKIEDARKQWGGGILSKKSMAKIEDKARLAAAEAAIRAEQIARSTVTATPESTTQQEAVAATPASV